MATAAPLRAAGPFGRTRDLVLPVAMIASLLVILLPMPAAVLDLLLAANIAVAVIVLLTSLYVRTPLEFNIFPSLLLATTLARLVLNIATTRLILTRAGTDGLEAAGGVVRNFGQAVTGDNLVVGFVIFAIIVVVQFLVITKGATRISEVAARFALDGMPGRQMAIDADLNAGLIDQHEAQRRRAEVAEQADFFGAMDGASKFVRGDAVAGILITLVNIVGGLAIGLIEYGMSFGEATSLFTRLTIGDGLVSQVPAFLISLAAGLLVTRSSSRVNLPVQFLNQLFSRPQALAVTAGFLGVLVFTRLPAAPLVGIGAGCTALALFITRSRQQAEQAARRTAPAPQPVAHEERVEDYLAIDPMELELGVGLIRLADPGRGGDLLERIGRTRQRIASDVGLIMPKVRIRDNLRLARTAYRIKIADMPVAEGELQLAMLLAIDSGTTTGREAGLATRDPATDMPAVWIEPAARREAERLGYQVVDPAGVISAHLTEVVRVHADELLNRDATKHLVDELRKTSPAVVDELIPGQMKLADVQQVLQLLLREGVSIRQLARILETLGEHAADTTEPAELAELVRRRLARAISTRYRDKHHRLYAITLDPAAEDEIGAAIDASPRGGVGLSPERLEALCRRIAGQLEEASPGGRAPVLLVSPRLRRAVKQLTWGHLPRLVVLSYDEVTRDTHIESLAGLPGNASGESSDLFPTFSQPLAA